MSDSARYHARMDAEGKTIAELREMIARAEAAPEWRGVEFDDARVRHKARTRLETLREVLAEREAEEDAFDPDAPITFTQAEMGYEDCPACQFPYKQISQTCENCDGEGEGTCPCGAPATMGTGECLACRWAPFGSAWQREQEEAR